MAKIVYNSQVIEVNNKIYLTQTKETFFCESTKVGKGFLSLKNVYRYKHDCINNRLEAVQDRSLSGVPIIKTKLTRDYILELK